METWLATNLSKYSITLSASPAVGSSSDKRPRSSCIPRSPFARCARWPAGLGADAPVSLSTIEGSNSWRQRRGRARGPDSARVHVRGPPAPRELGHAWVLRLGVSHARLSWSGTNFGTNDPRSCSFWGHWASLATRPVPALRLRETRVSSGHKWTSRSLRGFVVQDWLLQSRCSSVCASGGVVWRRGGPPAVAADPGSRSSVGWFGPAGVGTEFGTDHPL